MYAIRVEIQMCGTLSTTNIYHIVIAEQQPVLYTDRAHICAILTFLSNNKRKTHSSNKFIRSFTHTHTHTQSVSIAISSKNFSIALILINILILHNISNKIPFQYALKLMYLDEI